MHVVTRVNAWRDRRQARRDSLVEPPEYQYAAKMTAKLNVCIHGEDRLGHHCMCMLTLTLPQPHPTP